MEKIYNQVLQRILSQEKPAFLSKGNFIIPAYQGLSIANMPASVCRWFGCPLPGKTPLDKTISDQFEDIYDQVILLLVDGLNLSLFNQFYEDVITGKQQTAWAPFLSKSVFSPLTSIVPSTTSAALTTIWTGAQPIAHGIIGYELFLKEFGCIANMISHTAATFTHSPINISDAGFDAEQFLPVPTIGDHLQQNGVHTHTFQHHSIAHSGLSRMIFKGASNHAFQDETDLWLSAQEVLNNRDELKKFIYVYWGELDSNSHIAGPNHPILRDKWNTFAGFLYQFLANIASSLKNKTLFILTADHGQISTEIQPEFDLSKHHVLKDHLIMNPTGESRLPFLFIKDGHEGDVNQYLRSHWDQKFDMVSSSHFLQSGLMGSDPPSQNTLDRIGNWIVIPRDNAYWWWVKKENRLKGRHGGLSPQEMLVPFLAFSL